MANRIKVRTEWLDGCASDLQAVSNAIRAAQNTMAGINLTEAEGAYLKVGMSMGLTLTGTRHSANSVMQDVRALSNAASVLSSRVSRLGSGAKNAAHAFEDAENTAIRKLGMTTGTASDIYTGASPGAGSTASASGKTAQEQNKDGWTADWGKLLVDLISSAGPAGTFLAQTGNLIYKFATKTASWKDISKYLVKNGKAIVKWTQGEHTLKSLFGLEKYLEKIPLGTKPQIFKQVFKDKFNSSMTNKVNWVAAVLTSGIDNIDEGLKKHYTPDRIGVEWAAETVTSVAVSAGTSAAITAGLAALGVVNAPALAVAAGGALVLWGADTVVKNTIGGGEYGLVDGIGHLAGEGWEGAKESAKVIYNGLGKLKDKVCSYIDVPWARDYSGGGAW